MIIAASSIQLRSIFKEKFVFLKDYNVVATPHTTVR
jgi:hypothetical protein